MAYLCQLSEHQGESSYKEESGHQWEDGTTVGTEPLHKKSEKPTR